MHITSRNLLACVSTLALIAFAAIPAAAQPPEAAPATTEHEDAEPGEVVTAEDVTNWTAEDHAAQTQPAEAPADATAAQPPAGGAGGGGAGGTAGGANAATAVANTSPETAPLGSSGTGGTGGNGRPVQDPDKPR